MNKLDACYLFDDSLYLLRCQTRCPPREDQAGAVIASIVAVNLGTMTAWAHSYHLATSDFSPEIAAARRRDRVQNRPYTVSIDKEFLLRQHIKFDADLPIRTVGEYLMRWGMMSQNPFQRARAQDSDALESWTTQAYPEIIKRAKAQGRTVYWSDETGVRQDMNLVRSYVPIEQTPQMIHSARCDSIAMILAVTIQDLIDDARNKSFLIMDNLRVHHAKQVRQWVEDRPARIQLHYSPQTSPDGWLNRDRQMKLRLCPVPDETSLKKLAKDFMIKISSMPGWVVHYFISALTQCAA